MAERGQEGTRPIIYGPFQRRSTYADHGDHIVEPPRQEVNHAARVGARGDVVDDLVVPEFAVAMLNAAVDRMSVVSIEINSGDSITMDQSTIEETGGTSRACNILTRCCQSDTVSIDSTEANNELENLSVRTVNSEILADHQSVEVTSDEGENDDTHINKGAISTFDLRATPSGDKTSVQTNAETREATSKEVIKSLMDEMLDQIAPEPEKVVTSLLNDILDRVAPLEPEKVVKSLLSEMLDRVVPVEPENADIIKEVSEPKENKEKSKIRRMLSAVLCKNRAKKNDSVSTFSTGSGEDKHTVQIVGIANKELSSAQKMINASKDDFSTSPSFLGKLDSSKTKKSKSKSFRLFKGRNKGQNKGPSSTDNKVHPADAENTSSQTDSSNEAVNESEGTYPRVSAGQTEICFQKADIADNPAVLESPKKVTRKDKLRKVFHYCICIGSAYKEVDEDDEYIHTAQDVTTASAESQ